MNEILLNFRKELQNLGYSESVIINYPKYIKKLLIFCKEDPEKITTQQIKNYHEYLQIKPNERRNGKLSESYIYSNLLAIKRFFDYLERTDYCKENPFNLSLKSPKYQERNILSQEEIQILYKNCQNIEQTIILHLCYGCGLRRSEAVNITLKDINLEQKLLFVRQGKGKKRRVIPLTKIIAKDFKDYINLRNQNTESNFLLNNKGKKISADNMYLLFKKLLKLIDNPKITSKNICLHSLRHSIASHLLENQMTVEMVRDFLGHSLLNSTQIYTRVNLMKNEK